MNNALRPLAIYIVSITVIITIIIITFK